MKNLLVLCLLLANTLCAQTSNYHTYTLNELKTAHPDSVFAIDLSKQKLKAIPAEVLKFKKVKELNLGKNKLQDLSGLKEFAHLEVLNLERNDLETFPVEICRMPLLKTLIVNRNNFASIPSCIEFCRSLEFIDLWGTAVTILPETMFNMKQLQKIDIRGVNMTKTEQEYMHDLMPWVAFEMDNPCNCLD